MISNTEMLMARAIRAKCMDCSGHHTKLVANCVIKDCPLYPWREGTGRKTASEALKGQITMEDYVQQ